jgi:hypothetical protein
MEGNQMHVILTQRAGRKSAPKAKAQDAAQEPASAAPSAPDTAE